MTKAEHGRALGAALVRVCVQEILQNYVERNKSVIAAVHHALEIGVKAGVRLDKEEPEYPVMFIELPTGQVTWHIEQHSEAWDFHTTDEKYKRIRAYLGDMI